MARIARLGALAVIIAVGSRLVRYASDFVFAPPIIAATLLLGPWPTFVLCSVVYGVASYWLALMTVRAIDRRGESGRIMQYLIKLVRQEQSADDLQVIKSWWERGPYLRAAGLVVSSVFAGAIVTTGLWHIRYPRDSMARLKRVALVSSVLFGVTFSGLYVVLSDEIIRRLF